MGFTAVIADVANRSAVERNNNQQTEKQESSQIPKDKYEYTLDEIEVKDNRNGWSRDKGGDIDYADEETFQTLMEIYEGIDFYGEYKKGDTGVYNYYKEKYAELIKGEGKITDEEKIGYDGQNEFLLEDYRNDTEELEFVYFFDMDEDGLPELCFEASYGTYVVKYIPDTDQYIIWWGHRGTSFSITGSRKIQYSHDFGSDTFYSFEQLNEKGGTEITAAFWIEPDTVTGEYSYIVSLPVYEEESREPDIQKEFKKQLDDGTDKESYEFRVTKKQYEKLTENYFDAQRFTWREEVHISYFFPEMERIYSSCFEFPDNMAYADEQTAAKLEEIYQDIDFYGELKKGDRKAYEEYREKYAELLSGSVSFTDEYGKTYQLEDYIENWEEELRKPSTNLYYLDIDEDSLPELYIQGTFGNYLFKYYFEKDQYTLIGQNSPRTSISGKGKKRYKDITSYGCFYQFFQRKKNGDVKFSVEFGVKEPEEGKERLYMVSWPYYEKKDGNSKISVELKKQGYHTSANLRYQYYYRLTEKQYEKITKEYFKADTLLLKQRVPLTYFLPEK